MSSRLTANTHARKRDQITSTGRMAHRLRRTRRARLIGRRPAGLIGRKWPIDSVRPKPPLRVRALDARGRDVSPEHEGRLALVLRAGNVPESAIAVLTDSTADPDAKRKAVCERQQVSRKVERALRYDWHAPGPPMRPLVDPERVRRLPAGHPKRSGRRGLGRNELDRLAVQLRDVRAQNICREPHPARHDHYVGMERRYLSTLLLQHPSVRATIRDAVGSVGKAGDSDAEQIARMAVLEAVPTFEPSRGRFTTHARRSINGALIDARRYSVPLSDADSARAALRADREDAYWHAEALDEPIHSDHVTGNEARLIAAEDAESREALKSALWGTLPSLTPAARRYVLYRFILDADVPEDPELDAAIADELRAVIPADEMLLLLPDGSMPARHRGTRSYNELRSLRVPLRDTEGDIVRGIDGHPAKWQRAWMPSGDMTVSIVRDGRVRFVRREERTPVITDHAPEKRHRRKRRQMADVTGAEVSNEAPQEDTG